MGEQVAHRARDRGPGCAVAAAEARDRGRLRAASASQGVDGSSIMPPSRPVSRPPAEQDRTVGRAPAGRPSAKRMAARRSRAPCAGSAPGSPRAAARHQGRHGQARQAGRRGVQTSAPSSITAWAKSPARAGRGQRAGRARAAGAAPPGSGVVQRQHPRQHPLDIGVDRHHRPAAGDRGDRRRGVGADAGQRQQRVDVQRQPAAMLLDHRLRAGMQRRGRGGSSRGPARHAARRRAAPRPAPPGSGSGRGRARSATAHGGDGGLLQHQLADQDVPGVRPPRRAARARAGRAARGRTRPAAPRGARRLRRGRRQSGSAMAWYIATLARPAKVRGDRWRRTGTRGKGGPVRPGRQVARLLGSILDPAARRRGFAEASLLADWATIVGPVAGAPLPAAARSTMRPAGAAAGRCCCRSAAARRWRSSTRRRRLIERINTYFGHRAVRQLRLLQMPLPPRRAAPARATRPRLAAGRGGARGRRAAIWPTSPCARRCSPWAVPCAPQRP